MSGAANGITAGTLILTRAGYMPVEQVIPGTLILTGRRRWRPILSVSRCETRLLRIMGEGEPELIVGDETPMLTRGMQWEASGRLRDVSQWFHTDASVIGDPVEKTPDEIRRQARLMRLNPERTLSADWLQTPIRARQRLFDEYTNHHWTARTWRQAVEIRTLAVGLRMPVRVYPYGREWLLYPGGDWEKGGHGMWGDIRDVTPCGTGVVYRPNVAGDHTYMADGILVHD